jgi:hypothetical protein
MWYAVFIIIIQGEINVFRDTVNHSTPLYATIGECQQNALTKLDWLIEYQRREQMGETFIDALCLRRVFSESGEL